MNERELILDMLMEILEKGAYSHLVIRNVLNKYDYLKQSSKAFVKRVTEGTIEKQITIDYVLNGYSKTPVAKMKPLIRNLLRMSVYQMLFMDTVPDSAVCNEAVKLAGKRGFRNLQGFVNGVLRNIGRKKDQITYPDETDLVKCYSIRYSMPEWLVELFLAERGKDITERMLEDLQKIHPVTIRYCGPSDQQESWVRKAADHGIMLQAHGYLPYAYLVEGESIREIPGYEDGTFTVQDVSSMLVTEAAGLKGQEFLLDVCAAPGGKSLHAAGRLPEGKVLARDLTEYKVSLIEENRERLKCRNVEVETADASVLDERLIGTFDVVYADLPCSGLGILGKKRDIRYRMNPEQMEQLVELQKKILSVVWQYVKPGGILMYSTCTIHRAENEEMVQWLTENYPFRTERMEELLPEPCRNSEQDGMLQLLPGIHRTDGFFLAKLRRTGKGVTDRNGGYKVNDPS